MDLQKQKAIEIVVDTAIGAFAEVQSTTTGINSKE